MPRPRPVPTNGPTNSNSNSLSTSAADGSPGSDRTRGGVGAGAGHSVLLPPLPQGRSPLGRSSSPRHHSSSNAASTPARATTAAHATVISSSGGNSTPSRPQRRLSPLDWQNLEVAAGAPLEWGDDSLLDDLSAIAALGAASDNLSNSDDQYLLALADDDFSSPSAYPSFFDAPPAPGANYSDQWHQLSTSAQQAPAQPSAPATAAPHQHQPAAPSRTTTQLTSSSTGESQNTLFQDRFLDDEDAFPDTPLSSFSDTMPPTLRKRNPPAAAAATAQRDASASGAHMNKRRRASRAGSRPASRRGAAQNVDLVAVKDLEDEDEDLFGSSPGKRASKMEAKPEDGLTTIDLTESNEVPEDLSKPEEDNRVKLSVFQCVICMDDVTTLTVTHCGHLFCAQCLHQSLNVEATKGKCPMCRAKVDMKPRATYNTRSKGFWPLELKLMTSARKGKRKADTIS